MVFDKGRTLQLVGYYYKNDTPAGVGGVFGNTKGDKQLRESLEELMRNADTIITETKKINRVAEMIASVKADLDTLGRIEPENRSVKEQSMCFFYIYTLVALKAIKEDDHNGLVVVYADRPDIASN